MKILLYSIKKNIIIEIDDNNVIDELYNNLSILPTVNQLMVYDKTIIKPEEYINKIRDHISRLNYKLPLFDYATKNIYLINYEDIY